MAARRTSRASAASIAARCDACRSDPVQRRAQPAGRSGDGDPSALARRILRCDAHAAPRCPAVRQRRRASRWRRELRLSSRTVAQVLVRRGLGDPAAARALLAAAEDARPAAAFAGMDEAVDARSCATSRRGTRITVHGDYDVDGVCSTAILVRALRALGADVDWYLPSRMRRRLRPVGRDRRALAARGTRPAGHRRLRDHRGRGGRGRARRRARRRRHRPPPPARGRHAPRRADRASGALRLPVPGPVRGRRRLQARAGAAARPRAATPPRRATTSTSSRSRRSPTACRCAARTAALVRAGLRALARTGKPGLRALMRVARVDPSALDARALGFRLAPRINAAGRLHRADAGARAAADRRRGARAADRRRARRAPTPSGARRDADPVRGRGAGRRELGGQRRPTCSRARAGIPGVIGIVASRIVERHHRPAVLIALDGEPRAPARGARSRPSTCSAGSTPRAGHLERHGGHRAAAGLDGRAPTALDAFRAAFEAHAAAVLAPEDLVPVERVDAVVPGDALGLELAEELERLAPVRDRQPARSRCSCRPPRCRTRAPMGEGQHVRFTVARRRGALHAPSPSARRAPAGRRPAAGRRHLPPRASTPGTAPSSRGWSCGTRGPSAPEPVDVLGEPADHAGRPPLRELDAAAGPGRACRPRRAGAVRARADRPARRAALAGHPRATWSPPASRCSSSAPTSPAACDGLARPPGRLRALLLERAGARRRASPSAFAHVVALDPPGPPRTWTRAAPAGALAGCTHLAWGRR